MFTNSVDAGVGEFGYNSFHKLAIGILGLDDCSHLQWEKRDILHVTEKQHIYWTTSSADKRSTKERENAAYTKKGELTFKEPLTQSSFIVTEVFVLVNVIYRKEEHNPKLQGMWERRAFSPL